ncbi:MAG: pilus assembly protein PilQ [Myxococcales bacterium]|nr:pilus assembly protein PilQ [Myxococcales bacterium]
MSALLLTLALAAACGPECQARPITLNVKDADVHDVLRLLADTAGVNVVVPAEVQGRVTLSLRRVPWVTVLDTVLAARGLGRTWVGEVIYVDTLERLTEADAARLARRDLAEAEGRLVTRVIRLSYAQAAELAPVVRAVLSPRGTVVVDERTNSLVVTDVAPALEAAAALVARP